MQIVPKGNYAFKEWDGDHDFSSKTSVQIATLRLLPIDYLQAQEPPRFALPEGHHPAATPSDSTGQSLAA
jgi:hypothetical protein